MLEFSDQIHPVNNWILDKLPKTEYENLLPHLTPAHLPQGKALFMPDSEIQHVYFLNHGMVSLVSITQNGETVELAMVGSEGLVGLPVIFGEETIPYMAEVRVTGNGLLMDVNALRNEFRQGGTFQRLVLRYASLLISQLSQSAICNRFHTVGERLCKWLLIACDRVKSTEFKLTQEYLSQMMGSSRPNVTVAARALQRSGIIRYNRGQITIIDRVRLEAASCE